MMMSDRHAFSLKLITNGTKRTKPSLEKVKSITKSDDELIETGIDQTTADRLEEARLAEEALATNLKLLKKQKAKFMRLQKILSRNVILIPMCAIFSVMSAVAIFTSGLLDHYEDMNYDLTVLEKQIELENNSTDSAWTAAVAAAAVAAVNAVSGSEAAFDSFYIKSTTRTETSLRSDSSIYAANDYVKSSSSSKQNNEYEIQNKIAAATATEKSPDLLTNSNNNKRQQQFFSSFAKSSSGSAGGGINGKPFYYELKEYKDFHLVIRKNRTSDDNSSIKYNYIFPTYSGIWRICNNLSDESKLIIGIDKCIFYTLNNLENSTQNGLASTEEDPSRDLVRMHNAAACCIIVCYFLLGFSWFTALAAVITKKVPVTLATAVLNLLIAVFLTLLLALIHRKIISEERSHNCFDLNRTFDVVCACRTVRFGYSLGITWLALLFTIINGICWFHVTKMQKLLFTHGYF